MQGSGGYGRGYGCGVVGKDSEPRVGSDRYEWMSSSGFGGSTQSPSFCGRGRGGSSSTVHEVSAGRGRFIDDENAKGQDGSGDGSAARHILGGIGRGVIRHGGINWGSTKGKVGGEDGGSHGWHAAGEGNKGSGRGFESSFSGGGEGLRKNGSEGMQPGEKGCGPGHAESGWGRKFGEKMLSLDLQEKSDVNDGVKENKPSGPVTYVPPEKSVDQIFQEQHIRTGGRFREFFDLEVKCSVPVGNIEKIQGGAFSHFEDGHLPEAVLRNLDLSDYRRPTPIQQYAIPCINQGYDLMACAQTGSGKTAAFCLPVIKAIEKRKAQEMDKRSTSPFAIIIAPTRELAIQTFEQVVKYSHKTSVTAALVVGQHRVADQLSKLRRGCDIVSGTIGRLLQFVENRDIQLGNLQFLVLDEADKMLDMGFATQIRSLFESAGFPDKSKRQTLMFSATFAHEVQELAAEYLKRDYVFLQVGELSGANRHITQVIEEVPHSEKKNRLLELLREDISHELNKSGEYRKKTLVFAETKRLADVLGTALSLENIPAITIHGDRNQEQREEALRRFRTGDMCVLIATAVAERGLDIVGVDHVISYDLPSSCNPNYVHRIGRTGRVGNLGKATAFFDVEFDRDKAPALVQILSKAMQNVPTFLLKIAGECGVVGESSSGVAW